MEDYVYMKKYSIILMLFTLLLSGCCLVHDWKDATCTTPRMCRVCKETEGEPLGHVWLDATCTIAKTCEVCGETEGEPLGHIWREATCQEPKTCTVCGATEGTTTDHDWLEATCYKPRRCSMCDITEGTPISHVWVSSTYNASKYCANCGYVEGDYLEPGFPKRQFECNIGLNEPWEYVTIANDFPEEVKGTATIIDYREYYCDVQHEAKEGYEWREATVKFEMPVGCRTMWGYTDYYNGMEEYAVTNFITYPNGTKLPVRCTEAYKYDWEDDVCVSYGNLAVQVPEDYPDLVFYVCSADYAITHRIDPNIKFFEMMK